MQSSCKIVYQRGDTEGADCAACGLQTGSSFEAGKERVLLSSGSATLPGKYFSCSLPKAKPAAQSYALMFGQVGAGSRTRSC